MQTVLLTGVDQVWGSNLALAWANEHEVLGLSGRDGLFLPGCRTMSCDLRSPADVAAWIRRAAPQVIVHSSGICRSSWDSPPCLDQADAEIEVAASLPSLAREVAAQLVVLSPSVVFAGPQMFHTEDDLPASDHAWGQAARAIEQAVSGSDALLLRTDAFGWSPRGGDLGYAERLWQALHLGGAVQADGLRGATPILASDLAPRIDAAIQQRLRGLHHLGGAERASPHRFAVELASLAGMRVDPLRFTTSVCDAAAETSLHSGRLRKRLRLPLPTLRESLTRFLEQHATGWQDRLQGAGPRQARAA